MKLYAFTTPEIPKHDGYLKIGETHGDIDKRIKQESHELNVECIRVWSDAVITERTHIDKMIHRYLAEHGFPIQQFSGTGQNTEWIKCTIADIEKAFAAVKEQLYQDEIQRQELCDKFYLEIRNWYYWTAKNGNDPYSVADTEFTVRLIIRLLLCFFLQEKGLVPKELFDEHFLKENLKENEEYRYYSAILRNLFFHCLNTPIKERDEIEYKKLIKNIRNVKEQFHKVPFLNGGLFYEYEGDDFPLSDDYFFSELRTRHIVELGGDYKVAGIIRILSQYRYKLTVDDLFDLEYAQTVDPEFIGKVFESLLTCIDADTKENRRKVTGSFYTPKEVVDYMVNEALGAYLQNNNDLLQCKILDPACGSGAFPCNIMTNIMNRIDPDKNFTATERYRKKIEILQKIIYGVDIQPIAVQITVLRLFLSLIQEIVPDKKKDNYGIEPLPNLETKFICANTLISLPKEKQRKLELPAIKTTIKQLLLTREQHLTASTLQEKKRLQDFDEALRKTLSEVMEDAGDLSHETAELLLQWNPYDQTKSTPFFDPQYMFGITNGFDIVIENPPYVFARNSKFKRISATDKKYFYENYTLSEYQINLYPLFIEKGTTLLKNNGYLCLITPNNWLTLNTNRKLRRFVLDRSNITILNFYKHVFKSANVDSVIVLFQNIVSEKSKIRLAEWDKNYKLIGEIEKNQFLTAKDYVINIEAIKGKKTWTLLEKIENNGIALSQIAKVKCGLGAYGHGNGIPPQTKEMITNRVYHSKIKKGGDWFKYIEGEDVMRYFCGWNNEEYLKYGKHLREPRNDWNLFSTPRILVRQIPSPLPYCINACYTEETLLNDRNSMNIVYIKVSPLYLLGVLNSRVISYWFAYKFGKLQRGIFPQFKINELAQFPIPNASSDKQKPIIALVKKIFVAKKKNPAADTSTLEQQIDSLIYGLYGITPKEQAIIETRVSM
ncbi:MAG: N-6 DNA methylase [Planctomycetaceae bacterium]|jgi:hypothetical protein|nr:N-6 DNA methylase [Planctomycetaceae bacterium]